MKISRDSAWKIERDDGTIVELDMYEASALRNAMNRAWLWDEVELRFDEHPRWSLIQECKEEIIDRLCDQIFYEDDTVISDAIYDAVDWSIDLDLEEADDDV